MARQINCPSCRQSLYLPEMHESDERASEVLCSKCNYKYAVTFVEVLQFHSRVERHSARDPKRAPQYLRVYWLQALTREKAKAVQFSTTGLDHEFSATPGDELALLSVVRKKREDLTAVVNYTTGESCHLFSPRRKARSSGAVTSIITLIGGGLLAWLLQGVPSKVVLVATVPSSIGIGMAVTRSQSFQERDAPIAARLGTEQTLLGRLHSLDERISDLQQELKSNQHLLQRLKKLKQKMSRAGAELYAHRLETTERAIANLEKQSGLIQNLIDGYSKIVEIVEIEYDTSRVAEQLPENVAVKISDRLEEMEALEQQKEELALMVDPAKLLA
ncbi:MAG: hypothetical protein BRC40_10605 [Cyanobacteria bacterium QH_8_48_120]|nr:MAG: hypothetical protein BRC40_10605 [Cyanobacteria bacterium QH_8_48_120]PSO80359.1 MAG: hypothetical protein BRC41_17440 [Cyanobacteria bacterium QH_9_48_43]PSO99037.1 MAG: hypothetical protein BRC53_04220 [Cyanobacteria bacterium SW_6_48_11]